MIAAAAAAKLAILSLLAREALAAKILAIMLVPSRSHNMWNSKYLGALAERGHEITYVTAERMRGDHPNVRQIVFSELMDELFANDTMTGYTEQTPSEAYLQLDTWDAATSEAVAQSATFRGFLKLIREERFDLVVHDVAICNFMLGAVEILQEPPVIGITAFGQPSWVLDLLENPVLYSSHPHSFLPYPDEMTFFQRVNNFLFYIFARGTRALHVSKQNQLARQAFGTVKPLQEIMDKMNVVMVNANRGFDFPHARVPGLVPVGGLHIDPPKPLPKDLQTFLDSAKHGVVYFSLGTTAVSSNLGKDKVEALRKAFARLAPIKFLWKWNGSDQQGVPENIKLVSWLPQNDVLAHPNVKLFFTHSGLLSTQEAVYAGVPILGMPFLLDQFANLRSCVWRGIAEEVRYTTLTEEIIVEKITKVLNNPKTLEVNDTVATPEDARRNLPVDFDAFFRYRENVRRLSRLFRDTMVSPREEAVYWTEYVLRHGGAPHLSLHAKRLPWYQKEQIDVYLFLLGIASAIVYVAVRIIRVLCGRGSSKLKKS